MEIISKSKWMALNRAASRGDADAQWEVGYYHENGGSDRAGTTIVAKNSREAYRWYLASAKQGNSFAQGALCLYFSERKRLKRHYKSALYWGELAAAQGDSAAAFNLGAVYRDLGNREKAFECYEVALKLGDDDALLFIGLCLMFGVGTSRNLKRAKQCFQRLSRQSHPNVCQWSIDNARYWLGVLALLDQSKGTGAISKARKLLEQANKDDDHEQANDLLCLIGKTDFMR